MKYRIDAMVEADWPQVARIYKQGIEAGNATFEQTVPSWDQWILSHNTPCNLVARQGTQVLGYIALSPISKRCVFSGVAEVSIYVDFSYQGCGIGTALLEQAILVSEEHGYWTLESGIFPENVASIALHEKTGFRLVGKRERIGKMPVTNQWRDIVVMERRSKSINYV